MKISIALAGFLFCCWPLSAAAIDKNSAISMLKRYKCLSCHSVTRHKEGPSYQEVAKKYQSHPDPQLALYKHLTTSPTITVDGKQEQHKNVESKDVAEIKNLVEWILSN